MSCKSLVEFIENKTKNSGGTGILGEKSFSEIQESESAFSLKMPSRPILSDNDLLEKESEIKLSEEDMEQTIYAYFRHKQTSSKSDLAVTVAKNLTLSGYGSKQEIELILSKLSDEEIRELIYVASRTAEKMSYGLTTDVIDDDDEEQ